MKKLLTIVAAVVVLAMASACVQTTSTVSPSTTVSQATSSCISTSSKKGPTSVAGINFGKTVEIEIVNDTQYVAEIRQFTPTRPDQAAPTMAVCPYGTATVTVTRFLSSGDDEEIRLSATMLDAKTLRPNGCFARAQYRFNRSYYRSGSSYVVDEFLVHRNMYRGQGARC